VWGEGGLVVGGVGLKVGGGECVDSEVGFETTDVERGDVERRKTEPKEESD